MEKRMGAGWTFIYLIGIGIIVFLTYRLISGGEVVQKKTYLPLKVGNKWIYKSNKHREAKSFVDDIVEVKGTETVSGVTCFVVQETIKGEPDEITYYAEDKEGLMVYKGRAGGNDMLMTPPILYLPPQLTKEKRWEWKGRIGMLGTDIGSSMTKEVENEEDINVPAGRFKCFKIKTVWKLGDAMKLEYSEYISEGVGLIKEVSQFGTRELKKYHVE